MSTSGAATKISPGEAAARPEVVRPIARVVGDHPRGGDAAITSDATSRPGPRRALGRRRPQREGHDTDRQQNKTPSQSAPAAWRSHVSPQREAAPPINTLPTAQRWALADGKAVKRRRSGAPGPLAAPRTRRRPLRGSRSTKSPRQLPPARRPSHSITRRRPRSWTRV